MLKENQKKSVKSVSQQLKDLLNYLFLLIWI